MVWYCNKLENLCTIKCKHKNAKNILKKWAVMAMSSSKECQKQKSGRGHPSVGHVWYTWNSRISEKSITFLLKSDDKRFKIGLLAEIRISVRRKETLRKGEQGLGKIVITK